MEKADSMSDIIVKRLEESILAKRVVIVIGI